MQSIVFHAKNWHMANLNVVHSFDDYEPVAMVESDNLEKVFELTNHIESNWTMNMQVAAVRSQLRSTSVGDIVLVCNDEGNKYWICRSRGWEELKDLKTIVPNPMFSTMTKEKFNRMVEEGSIRCL